MTKWGRGVLGLFCAENVSSASAVLIPSMFTLKQIYSVVCPLRNVDTFDILWLVPTCIFTVISQLTVWAAAVRYAVNCT